MKVQVYNKDGSKTEDLELPRQFTEEFRPDLIKKAVLAIQNNGRQAYGADPMAGKKCSAELSRRRHDYRGSYGHGISRVPRKIMTRNGTRMNWVGAFAPGTVGGRRAHPPKSEKIWNQDINKKENRFAIRSALAATLDLELIKSRGQVAPEAYPLVFDVDVESIEKTKDLSSLLKKLGFDAEMQRAKVKEIRAGKGKTRGRPYKKKKSILFVTSKICNLTKAAKNISGVDIITVNGLNAEFLAPGTVAGRMTIFTKEAIEALEKNKMFE